MARTAFLLRIDPALKDALQRWAEEELRSLNGQIEYLLRQALARRGVKPTEEGEGGGASPKGRGRRAARGRRPGGRRPRGVLRQRLRHTDTRSGAVLTLSVTVR